MAGAKRQEGLLEDELVQLDVGEQMKRCACLVTM